jgi:ATPase subunit of ABC transporter with duplicated ATPase domains
LSAIGLPRQRGVVDMSIIFKEISKIYNGKKIFNNISGRIYDGEKVGVIGINGIGKTTLVRILLGIEEKDSGEISFAPENIRFGYLNQYTAFDDDITVYEELYKSGLTSMNASFNIDSYKNRLKKSLLGIGFSEKDFNQPTSRLSGGEKTRLSICKILMEEPDVLVLDEPTNHLDMESIKWLEDFLRGIKKTVIIISHDRQFLDNTVERILEMKYDCLNEYKGNYSEYKIQKENEMRNQQREYEKQERNIKHLKEVISDRKSWFEKAHNAAGVNDFLRAKAKKHISVMRAKQKQLERLEENKIKRPEKDITAAFEYMGKAAEGKKLPEYLLQAGNLHKAFGRKAIFENASFDIKRGERIALIGKNGSGKSTLIKMIVGDEGIDKGYINTNPSLKIAYFSQELENLDFNSTILDDILKEKVPVNSARLVLGCLLFKDKDVYKKIEVLSMGEKCRVAFAKLILSGADMLILDEPTNYMDIVSREKIEEVLEDYKGTLLFVSHDRYFVKRASNRIFEIEDRRIKIYEGNYEYYLTKKVDDEKKEKIGVDYTSIRDEIRRLECELAFMSGRFDDPKLGAEEKAELDRKFIETSRKIREYKEKVM